MRRLDRDEIDEVLVRNGIGLLAMVDDGRPYAVPMSFGYDADRMVFPMQWGGGRQSRKSRIIESNPNVCLTVYEQGDDDEAIWRSVVITGELYEIADDEREQAYASLAANAEFPPTSASGASPSMTSSSACSGWTRTIAADASSRHSTEAGTERVDAVPKGRSCAPGPLQNGFAPWPPTVDR
ncbi:pyridoxamine 5'-phosphate oxidase family protein [Haloplanus salilacus]|uniref:pyridoxamine 5'-phosphate oxidase family protein n=1 Tax=Haloplanus salilacus TaxID=2949994 RepID=UPI0030CEAC4E